MPGEVLGLLEFGRFDQSTSRLMLTCQMLTRLMLTMSESAAIRGSFGVDARPIS